MSEKTLAMIKPDAVSKNNIGAIIAHIESAGLKIREIKMLHMSKHQAEGFYQVHSERPFFSSLVEFMSSGPAVIMVLEGNNAVAKYRQLMGATNPDEAENNTLRALFAESIDHNAVHGSDSNENAKIEIEFFFGSQAA
jgi:nucleoside-diphosphate kinase